MHKFKNIYFAPILLLLFCSPILSFGQVNIDLSTNEGLNLPYYSNPETEDLTPSFLKLGNIADKIKDEALKAGDVLRLDRLFFEADRDEIQTISFPMLDQLAQALNEREDIKKVEIGGFTNSLPPDAYCDQLSESRAEQVYQYLVSKNVDPDRLVYKGYGKRKPVASDKTLEGRRQNQRVEIKILNLD